MAKYIVAETVTHYHEVEIDDELDILDIVDVRKGKFLCSSPCA